MQGATDIRLNVTMDSTQARAESERLHKELSRRYRAPDEKDALRRSWDKITGMPVNPMNPDLPYEEARHSGIWWANQRGIRGLGNQEYRHQFFTEREAKYMGLQFAKGARKELVSAGKSLGITLLGVLASEGISTATNYYTRVGKNNRTTQVAGSYAGGIATGALTGAMAGAALGSVVPAIGNVVGAVGGAVIGGIGGAFNGVNAQISNRNEDDTYRQQFYTQDVSMREGRRLSFSDMALQRQMEMMPSRVGKLQLIGAQLEQLTNGAGKMSIKNLEGLRDAMLNGGTWGGRRFEKGDLNTTEGQQVLSFLQTQYGRRESLLAQRQQLQFTPFARPQESITDDYARRGFFVGAQVDVQDTNRVIIADMKRIIKLLDETRRNTADNSGTW